MNKPFIIVGANLTGLCCALALSRLNQASVLIDKKDIHPSPNKDGRAIALSYGSKQILETLGIWQKIEPYAGEINQIRVTDQYSPLFLHFDNNNTLGYIIEAEDLQRVIYQEIIEDHNISIFSNTNYQLIENNHTQVTIKLDDQIINTDLLIAADGKFSQIRKLSKIDHFQYDYKQKS